MHYKLQEGYRYDERRDAAIARALGHAGRIRLLRQLRRGPATAAQLAARHATGRFALAGHLRALVLARLIAFELVEAVPVYRLATSSWPSWLHAYVDRSLMRPLQVVARAPTLQRA